MTPLSSLKKKVLIIHECMQKHLQKIFLDVLDLLLNNTEDVGSRREFRWKNAHAGHNPTPEAECQIHGGTARHPTCSVARSVGSFLFFLFDLLLYKCCHRATLCISLLTLCNSLLCDR